ncbi:MAG: nucleotidyltransferase [Candidatus Syntrophonatronum acetioxidans]|uniref:Nucleotidyltransferase n=1 Tax=Candidatus Syntrophonatronum acetioxidans TaxID=1795816 RepID=A0A424Y9U9_9FIRM|nr:MAG: nucleotidyltransferase [Candidatus Syntrophonatronum acetioxidans]
MKAIIMAGGGGTRLRPLTCDRPKPMVPIMNKPIMEHIVKLLKKHGIREIGVTLQYMPEAIRDYFKDGSSWEVNLNYFVEETPLGTAGSVKNASSFLKETFLVISGDALTDIDLTSALNFHKEKGALATLVLTTVQNPLEYGVVITDEGGNITRFLEKPGWGEVFSDRVNTGIYLLEPEVLDLFPEEVKFDFSKDLFPSILEKRDPLFGFVAQGYWCDIGNLEQYQQATFDILEGKVDIHIEEEYQGKGIWLGKGAEISSRAIINGPVVLGEDSRIESKARVQDFSVLGKGTVIDEEASLKKSICWSRVYVGRRSELRGTIVCKGVRMEEGTGAYEGSVIGDKSIMGKGSQVKPETKVWPHKNIQEGSVLNQSVIWGRKTWKNLFSSSGIKGIPNQDIIPELMVQAGNAFSSILREDRAVVVASDDWKVSRMLKQALISGINGAGREVLHAGELLAPAVRFTVKGEKAAGGIYLHRSVEDSREIQVKFFDEKGLNVSKAMERKIEQVCQREEFSRVPPGEVGEVRESPAAFQKYREMLWSEGDGELLRKVNAPLVLAFMEPLVYNQVIPLFKELQVETLLFEPFKKEEKPLSFPEIRRKIKGLSRVIRENGASLGAVLDRTGEGLILVDDKERIIEGDYFTALISYLLFKEKEEAVVVPVNASGVVDKIAEKFEGTVIRAKTSPPFIMEELDKKGLHFQYILQFDATAALLSLLEFLNGEEKSLSQVMDEIPEFHLTRKRVKCPWGAKGKVMRKLIEECREEKVELLDGIKIHTPRGWALILPDPEEPYYQVYGEGYNEEVSESLTDFYIEKIREIQEKEE